MKNSKRLLYFSLVLIVIISVFFGLHILNEDSTLNFNNSKDHIAIVDRGKVILSIEATGIVEAENEVIILSPSSSIIKKINKEPGSRVEQGMVIIELDPEPIKNEIDRISDQLEVKRNTLEKSRLNKRSTIIDLEYNVEVKGLKITSLKAKLADEEQLLSVGGISPSRLDETKQNLVLAERDLSMIIEKNEIRQKQLKTDEEGLLLQINIQEKQLAGKMKLLEEMEVKAPSDGIVLNIEGKVGEKVAVDRMLVKMSDLSTFKIIGSFDEKYSENIKTGNLVYVILDSEKLEGRIGNITPVVENNKIQFNVHFDYNNHPKLIANQAVKMLVVQTLKNDILRIPKNDNFDANKKQIVFVKDSESVVQRSVEFGIEGTDFQEILSGLEEGDVVLLSKNNDDIID